MKQRKLHYDILRIIASLCVIYNHTSERGYYLYAFPCSFILKDFYIAVAALIAVAVPIFFMISGALLLSKDEPLEVLYKKRVSRMVAVLLVFSCVQYAVLLRDHHAELSLSYFAKALFDDGMISPYWFLYAYIAYLLILPFLRKLTKVMDKKDYHYLFALLLIIEGVLPTILFFFGITEISDFFVVPMLNRVVVYPLLGYYMENHVEEEKYCAETTKKVLLSIVLVLVFFVLMTRYRDLPYEEFTRYDKGLYTCSFTMILDAGVYYLVKRFCMKHDLSRWSKVSISLGSATFGMYLIEQPIREHIPAVCDRLVPYIGHFPACMVYVVVVFIIAYIITLLMKCIPGLRRLL